MVVVSFVHGTPQATKYIKVNPVDQTRLDIKDCAKEEIIDKCPEKYEDKANENIEKQTRKLNS